jgi:rhodanese-related sulfurtransferase/predicted metal-dependent enzyme (double-stranded beta helix superfamily)
MMNTNIGDVWSGGEPDAASLNPAGNQQQTPSLRRVVLDLASCQETWIERVRLTTDQRWYERLYSGAGYDVWVISWLPGQSTGFHDHGGSCGAYCVVSGVLEDRRPGEGSRVVGAGQVEAFGPAQIHDVRNASSAPAISLHAYSPALTEMTHYDVDDVDVRRAARRRPTESSTVVDPASTFARRQATADDAGLSRIDRALSAARTRLRRLTAVEAHRAVEVAGASIVDIRPTRQREEEGSIPGALILERNVLEWRLDPTSPDRLEIASGHDAHLIVVCSEGYASSLAAESLRTLGLWRATDVIGGFKAWAAAGLPALARARSGEEIPRRE